jgi:hypothetical protein
MRRLAFLAPVIALPLLLTGCGSDEPAQPSCVEIDIDHPKPHHTKTSKPRTVAPPKLKAPSKNTPAKRRRR